jgi:hypothetical protein
MVRQVQLFRDIDDPRYPVRHCHLDDSRMRRHNLSVILNFIVHVNTAPAETSTGCDKLYVHEMDRD